MYLVTDVDLIKQVFVKEFSKFHNRPVITYSKML